MIKERIKTSAIIILLINMLFLSTEIWFVHSYSYVGERIFQYVKSAPVFREIFPKERTYSIPKENLSKPRKFLINDGSLWMAYYNTDIGYLPIEQRTRNIIEGFLKGDITAFKRIDYNTWEEGLESLSIYIEYPISFSVPLLCDIMGISSENAPQDIEHVGDFIILPSGNDTNIYILVRDSADNNIAYAYMLSDKYSLPAEDLSVYTNSSDGYYEPAFSTGLRQFPGNVSIDPLVLFSDSQPQTEVLRAQSLTDDESRKNIIGAFSFNPVSVNDYTDKNGSIIYIENYASAKFYSDSLFEYTAVSYDKGILLNEDTDAYSMLNSAIDFAENVWRCVSNTPLNVLLTSDLSDYDSTKPYTFRFDYYCNGRPVEIQLDENNGHEKISCAIEITTVGGRLISYRQYMRSYEITDREKVTTTFIDALDYFVSKFSSESQEVVISDIYIGYLDDGKDELLNAAWLANVNDTVYSYIKNTAVSEK